MTRHITMVALSTADTNKWATLHNRSEPTPESQVTSFDYERTGPIRQRQRRLSEAQALLVANKYQNGATVYQLAQEFGISRKTVSERIRKAGITMRRQSPGSELIDSMVGLYESGMSLAEVGDQVGTSPGTVHRYLLICGVQMRDSHGRKR
jgi:DNA-directed RNA polymerase specialized sigma24 family protein